MYSLIKYVCLFYCNKDILNLILCLYRDIIMQLTRYDSYTGSLYKSTYHIRNIRWYFDTQLLQIHSYVMCDVCRERNYDPTYRLLKYVIRRYSRKSETDSWQHDRTDEMIRRCHHDCFKKRYGIIYDF